MRPWEVIGGYFPPKPIRRRLIAGYLFLLRFFAGNLTSIRRHGRIHPRQKRYIRPPRPYYIPVHQPGMKHCTSNKNCLRPTLYCNSHAPEVIALAHQLGAYRESNREYAEAAFEFVKRKITGELIPLDGVERTLHRGTGTCLHKLALLVALCRAAGISARYKLYALTAMDTVAQTLGLIGKDRQWSEETGNLLLHGEAEMYIEGEWVVASIGLTPERQASLNLPITRFGEVALGVWYPVDPESVVRLESIPHGLNALMRMVYRLAPAHIDTANANLLEQCKRGRAILDEKGERAYDDEIRRHLTPNMPEAVMTLRTEITFER